jgi:hypothetical protein
VRVLGLNIAELGPYGKPGLEDLILRGFVVFISKAGVWREPRGSELLVETLDNELSEISRHLLSSQLKAEK